jgi:tetratricopeptide (TPR) repeat protein
MATAYFNRGYAWGHKGEHDKAITDYSQALAIDPKKASAYCNRGIEWMHKGEHDKAIADFDRALAIDPNSAKAYHNRGNAWWLKDDYDKAIADYSQAVVINPNMGPAYSGLAWLYATCPDAKYRDAKKAVENADKACQLSGGNDFDDLDTLAAAYAECGDFARAQEFEWKAIALAPVDIISEFMDRLEHFEQGEPYRAAPMKGA